MDDEGGLQHPWARLAHAQALLAGGDEGGCAAVLQTSLRTFHIADKSAVRVPTRQPVTEKMGNSSQQRTNAASHA